MCIVYNLASWNQQRVNKGSENLCPLPLPGSGKIPWLLLLITEFFGESSPCPCAGPSPCPCPGPIPGTDMYPWPSPWPCPWPEPEPGGPWAAWWALLCSMLSLCSLRGSQRGVLSNWAVFDKSIKTWEKVNITQWVWCLKKTRVAKTVEDAKVMGAVK